jgi:hypothetical protein
MYHHAIRLSSIACTTPSFHFQISSRQHPPVKAECYNPQTLYHTLIINTARNRSPIPSPIRYADPFPVSNPNPAPKPPGPRTCQHSIRALPQPYRLATRQATHGHALPTRTPPFDNLDFLIFRFILAPGPCGPHLTCIGCTAGSSLHLGYTTSRIRREKGFRLHPTLTACVNGENTLDLQGPGCDLPFRRETSLPIPCEIWDIVRCTVYRLSVSTGMLPTLPTW